MKRNLNRIVSIILAIVLVISTNGVSVFAQDRDMILSFNDDNGDEVSKTAPEISINSNDDLNQVGIEDAIDNDDELDSSDTDIRKSADIFNSGSGTEDDPFLIYTQGELQKFNEYTRQFSTSNDTKGKYYALAKNITLSDDWKPLRYFYGHFDGRGYTIYNLKIRVYEDDFYGPHGFFDRLDSAGSTVKNLTIDGVEFVSAINYSSFGAISGEIVGNVIIDNCTVQGIYTINAEGDAPVGGLIGTAGTATITNCINKSNIKYSSETGKPKMGGIAGNAGNSYVNCKNYGDITNNGIGGGAAGIVWITSNGEIEGCVNEGNITVDFSKQLTGIINRVAGITSNAKIVKKCINRGNLSECEYVAGIVNEVKGGDVSDCKNEASLSGINVAGVVNNTDGNVEKCENTGAIIGVTGTKTASSDVAGIVDYVAGNVTGCINSGDVSIVNEKVSSASIGGIAVSIGGDILKCENSGAITANIDVSQMGGIAASAKSAMNCKNTGAIEGKGALNVGGIIGKATASTSKDITISYCANTGRISETQGKSQTFNGIGGIIGRCDGNATINDCYDSGEINANSTIRCSIGGIVGTMPSRSANINLSNCYTSNVVKGTGSETYLGGLIGEIEYDTIKVDITSSYYISSSKKAIGINGGTGNLTTSNVRACSDAELKKQDTYLDWDFDNVWEFGEEDYPYPILREDSQGQGPAPTSGVSGNIIWALDTVTGRLTINGTGDWIPEDIFGNPPWSRIRTKIKSAEVSIIGITTVRKMFAGCSNLEVLDMSESDLLKVVESELMLSDCNKLSIIKTPINLNTNIELGWLFTDHQDFLDDKLPNDKPNSITIYKATEYRKISYYGNSILLKEKYYIPGQEIERPNDTKLDGYDCVGWYENAAYTGKEFFDNGNADARLEKNSNFSLYGELHKIEDANSNNRYKAPNKGQYVDILLNETRFMRKTTVYNHDLARFAIEMSTLCYSEKPSSSKLTDEVSEALEKLGFYRIEHHTYQACVNSHHNDVCYGEEKKAAGAYSPYWIASKKIKLDGKETTIVGVFIRGTYCEEWIDNFDPLTGDVHEGFSRAAYKVVEEIKDYYEKYIDGESKILVTGHSRGAATANLIGKILDDGAVVGISQSNLFTYTYATPNTAKLSDSDMAKYWNIYNIVNPEDFVTKLLPSKWGYGRYGMTYVLPSSTTDGKRADENHVDYSNYVWAVNNYLYNLGYEDSYDKIVNSTLPIYERDYYFPYDLGMWTVANYISSVTSIVNNISKYYEMDIRPGLDLKDYAKPVTLQKLFTQTLGYHQSKVKKYVNESNVALAAAAAGVYGPIGRLTIGFFAIHQATAWKTFEKAHMPEYYLAAMNVLSEAQLKAPRKSLWGIVNCPIDVNVYNSDGELVGQITDNKVQEDITSIAMNVEGDSKTFCLPSTEDYKIELIGNDEGTMDYTLLEMDADTGEVERVFYNDLDVDIEDGNRTKYTQDIVAEGDINTFSLVNDASLTIPPTLTLSGEQLGQLSVATTTEGAEGYADNLTNLSPGDYVMLNAYETDSSFFEGWYNDKGELVSKDNPYGFSISENESLVARFKEVPNGLYTVVTDEENYEYNGNAVTPKVKVFNGKIELVPNKDYTIKYKNNKNAYTYDVTDNAFDTSKAPAIIVNGKGGNYTGVYTKYFTINPLNLSDPQCCKVLDVLIEKNGQVQKAKPIVKYYINDKWVTLKENTDYTLSYPDRESGSYSEAGKYSISINGKGNYCGTVNVWETITESNVLSKLSYTIKNGSCTDENYISGTPIYPSSLIVKNGKATLLGTLVSDVSTIEDVYTLIENDETGIVSNGYNYVYFCTNNTQAGTANITFVGVKQNGYEGVVNKTYSVSGLAMSKAKIDGLKASYPWKAEGVDPFNDGSVVVKYGTKTLNNGTDYAVSYSGDITSKGTIKATIKGQNQYSGTVTKSFKITGIDISKSVTISGVLAKYEYTGRDIRPAGMPGKTDDLDSIAFKVVYKIKGKPEQELTKGVDYTVSYLNNVNAGIGQIIIEGIGNCSGKYMKKFTIVPKSGLVVEAVPIQNYEKNGSKPTVYVYDGPDDDDDRQLLTQGVDYTVTYANNNKVHEDVSINTKKNPAPKVTVKGKGNYSGSSTVTFAIKKSNLQNLDSAEASNITYTERVNIYKVKPTLVDRNGVKLKENTDYEIVGYKYAEDTVVSTMEKIGKSIVRTDGVIREADSDIKVIDIIPADTSLKVVVKGKGNYETSTKEIHYSILSANIADVTAKVAAQTYTGKEVKPDKSDISLYHAGSVIDDENYEIVSYANNIQKGTGYITIVGKENYSGTAKIKFSITTRSLNYTITFDKNADDAKGTMKVASVSTGTRLPQCGYTRPGYTFVGWHTYPYYSESDTIAYKNQETFRIKKLTQMFGTKETLYAQWKPINVEVAGKTNDIIWKISASGKLTISGTGDWERSGIGVPPWCSNEYKNRITSAEVKLTGADSLANMFFDCRNMTSVNLKNLDTSSVSDMNYMFAYCTSLKNVDLSGFKTSNVTNMSGMFIGCSNIEQYNLSKFDTSNVVNMACMFMYNDSLQAIDLSSFNTENCTDMSRMFLLDKNLKSVNLSGLINPKLVSVSYMFSRCEKLSSIDLSTFEMGNLDYCEYANPNMLESCNSLRIIKTPKTINCTIGLDSSYVDNNGLSYSSINPENVNKVLYRQ